eukprot:707534-Rhodomonas_salina.1
MAPPFVAILLVKLHAVVRVRDDPVHRPPPSPLGAVFPTKISDGADAGRNKDPESEYRPPPLPPAAVFLKNVIESMVRVLPKEATAPPDIEAALPVNMLFARLTVLESALRAPPLPEVTEFMDQVVPPAVLVTVLVVSAYTAPPPVAAVLLVNVVSAAVVRVDVFVSQTAPPAP